MGKTRKRVRMVVEVSVPVWATAAEARKLVAQMLPELAHDYPLIRRDDFKEGNLVSISVKPVPKDASLAGLVEASEAVLAIADRDTDAFARFRAAIAAAKEGV